MGKDVPLGKIFDTDPRPLQRGRRVPRALRGRRRGQEGRRHRQGPRGAQAAVGRARGRRDHVLRPAARPDPDHEARAGRRDHHAVRLPDLRVARPDQDGLPRAAQPDDPRRRARQHRDEPRRDDRARGAHRSTTRRPSSCSRAATRSGVFQLDGGPMRALLRSMRPGQLRGHLGRRSRCTGPGPMGANSHNEYADRKNGRKPVMPIHPELAEPLADILGDTYGLIIYQEQVMAIAQKVAGFSLGQADILRRAMGKKKKSELDKQYEGFAGGMKERGYSDGGGQDAVGHPAAVLRLRVQQGALGGVRPGLVLDGLPQGELPGRVHGRAAHVRQGRQGQDGDLPGRVPADGHQGAAAVRELLRRQLHPGRARTSASG